MAVEAFTQFSRNEMAFREMLRAGGKLIGGKWFGADSSEFERALHLVANTRRQERNRRRRERRKLEASNVRGQQNSNRSSHSNRSRRRIIPLDPEAQVANRLPLERRKCLRRSTLAECPTPADIRTAWHFRNTSNAASVRLGGMLLDLECYVDNSLITIVCRNRLKIVGRHGGLRAWIREHCPELSPHYKTLQRIKGNAKILRQRLDVMDPIPVSMLMSNNVPTEDIETLPVHVQPRGDDEVFQVRTRFPWEESPLKIDADGRPYFNNANYTAARLAISSSFLDDISGYRAIFRAAIILNGKEKCANENYSKEVKDDAGIGEGMAAEGWADFCRKPQENGAAGDLKRFCGEMGEMFRYIGRNPKFLAEVGMDLGKDVGRAFGELLLPERTLARIRDGERVGLGRAVLDMMSAYGRFYSSCLVYRWGRGYDEGW